MKRPGAHLTLELWSDFVRHAATPANDAAMRAHLDTGCGECRRTVELLRELARHGETEAACAVPPELTARVRAIFMAQPNANAWVEQLRQVVAELVWRPQPGWQVQGVRSTADTSRRLLYRAGDYSVDLQIEPRPGQPDEIVGQILNESDRTDDLEGILVQVVATGHTLGETATNRFGEFVVACPAGKRPMLRLALRRRQERIDLHLPA